MLVFEFYILDTLILYHQYELLLNNWLYLRIGHSGTCLKPQHLEASLGYLAHLAGEDVNTRLIAMWFTHSLSHGVREFLRALF